MTTAARNALFLLPGQLLPNPAALWGTRALLGTRPGGCPGVTPLLHRGDI